MRTSPLLLHSVPSSKFSLVKSVSGGSVPIFAQWNRFPRRMRSSCRAAGGRPACSPASPAAAGAALNRARRKARRSCSISRPTRSTPASTRRQAEGFYEDAGVDLKVQPPGESTDAPKLLAAGRTDFAILDIHDLGIARERGSTWSASMPIVQRPLAAVIARGDGPVQPPARPRGPHGRRHRPALRRSGRRLRGRAPTAATRRGSSG